MAHDTDAFVDPCPPVTLPPGATFPITVDVPIRGLLLRDADDLASLNRALADVRRIPQRDKTVEERDPVDFEAVGTYFWLEKRIQAGDAAPQLGRLEAENDNLRAALAWCGAAGEYELELRLASGLSLFWNVRGYLSEGRRWLDDALARYERGVALLRVCYAQLRDAEQKIQLLAGRTADGSPELLPFEHTAAVEKEKPATKRKAKPPSGGDVPF